jgi:hypothetical protein
MSLPPTDFRDSEGWGWPYNSKKSHYFREGEIVSICRRWAYIGPRETGKDDSPDNCAKCKRRVAKL